MDNKRDEYTVKQKTVLTSNGDNITIKKNTKTLANMNALIQKMLGSVKSFSLSSDMKATDQIDDFNKEINDVLDKETERFMSNDSGATGKDIALFMNDLFSRVPKGLMDNMGSFLQNRNLDELMNDQNAQINIVLSERYKNVNSMYEDIRLVTEQLTELSEVIDTMRDTITNSDNLLSDLSRQITFTNSGDDNELNKNVQTVISMEESTNIKEKLKKVIIPETLKYGNFFVFTQPYNDLFAKFKAMDDKFKSGGMNGVQSAVRIGESWQPTMESTSKLKEFYESYAPQIESTFRRTDKKLKKYTSEMFVKDIENYLKNIEVVNDETIPLMEDSKVSALAYADVRKSIEKAVNNKKKDKTWNPINSISNNSKYSDGVVGSPVNYIGNKELNKYQNEFKEITGVFMKLYDPRRVIPIFVMEYNIGYYVLYETVQETTSNVLNAVHTLSRTTMLFQNERKKEFENKLVGLIADRICKSIDKPFLQKNSEFKELIANAIAYDDFYKKSFRVQFVPNNYMTHFKVNIDYNTHMGVSVLKRSLFYAMLYLTLLLFKIIMIVTRSSDTRMFLIHTSEEDQDPSSRVNKIIGDFRQNQISYNDFGSVRGILSKVGKGKDIGIPLAPNGDRAFDVEVMQGQSVDLDTPLMEMLRKSMVSNTGCPSAMLNFLDEVDYARQLPMMHSKYVSRMVTMQEETESSISELYRKLLRYGGYEIDDDKLGDLKFTWSRPKSLNNTNLNDMIGNAEQLTEFMLKVFVGENSEEDARVKDRMFKHIVTKHLLAGVFDWNELEKEFNNVLLNLRADIKEEDLTKIKSDED